MIKLYISTNFPQIPMNIAKNTVDSLSNKWENCKNNNIKERLLIIRCNAKGEKFQVFQHTTIHTYL